MINPWILVAMIPAMLIILLQLGIGPFAHPTLLHWHTSWRQKLTPIGRRSLVFLATLILLAGSLQLFGV